MTMVAGNVAYARSDWYTQLTGGPGPEQIPAWGREMTLDISYAAKPAAQPPPTLAALRKAILTSYRQAGPIFA